MPTVGLQFDMPALKSSILSMGRSKMTSLSGLYDNSTSVSTLYKWGNLRCYLWVIPPAVNKDLHFHCELKIEKKLFLPLFAKQSDLLWFWLWSLILKWTENECSSFSRTLRAVINSNFLQLNVLYSPWFSSLRGRWKKKKLDICAVWRGRRSAKRLQCEKN